MDTLQRLERGLDIREGRAQARGEHRPDAVDRVAHARVPVVQARSERRAPVDLDLHALPLGVGSGRGRADHGDAALADQWSAGEGSLEGDPEPALRRGGDAPRLRVAIPPAAGHEVAQRHPESFAVGSGDDERRAVGGDGHRAGVEQALRQLLRELAVAERRHLRDQLRHLWRVGPGCDARNDGVHLGAARVGRVLQRALSADRTHARLDARSVEQRTAAECAVRREEGGARCVEVAHLFRRAATRDCGWPVLVCEGTFDGETPSIDAPEKRQRYERGL